MKQDLEIFLSAKDGTTIKVRGIAEIDFPSAKEKAHWNQSEGESFNEKFFKESDVDVLLIKDAVASIQKF